MYQNSTQIYTIFLKDSNRRALAHAQRDVSHQEAIGKICKSLIRKLFYIIMTKRFPPQFFKIKFRFFVDFQISKPDKKAVF